MSVVAARSCACRDGWPPGRGPGFVAKAKRPQPIRRGLWPRFPAGIAARFRRMPPAFGFVRRAARLIRRSPDATGTGGSCARSAGTPGISTGPHSAIGSSDSSASIARPSIGPRGARSGAGATTIGCAALGGRNGTPPWTGRNSRDAILGSATPRGVAHDEG
jgi:hypothetical protein